MNLKSSLINYLKGNALSKEQKQDLPSDTVLNEWENVWEKAGKYAYPTQQSDNAAWDNFSKNIQVDTTLTIKRNPLRFLKYAASIALLIGTLGYFVWNTNTSIEYTAFKTSNNEQKNYNVTDNIAIKLNYNSNVEHKNNFDMFGKDTLHFNGEGFFNVVPLNNTDFYIQSNNSLLHITGTVFNLKTSDKEDKITVTRGKVSVNKNGFDYKIPASQTCVISNNNVAFRSINTNKDTGWVEGILVFENTDFNNVVKKLEQRFNQKITYPKHLSNQKYSGTFKQKDLTKICDILSLTYGEKVRLKKE